MASFAPSRSLTFSSAKKSLWTCCRRRSIFVLIFVSICSLAFLSRENAPSQAPVSPGRRHISSSSSSISASFSAPLSSPSLRYSLGRRPLSGGGTSRLPGPASAISVPQWKAGELQKATGSDILQALATVDLGERLLSQQASMLLDETWEPSLTDRLWNRLLGTSERERLEAARLDLAIKMGRPIPIKFASPWYARRWPEIRSSLRRWAQSRRVYDPGVLFTLLETVKGPIDEHYIKLPLGAVHYGYTAQAREPYKSCAVVGNSGELLEGRYGPSIDAHEAVFRLNNARIAGFGAHVGTKTTLSFVNSNVMQACAGEHRCFCQPYGAHVPVVLYIAQPAHFTEVVLCAETQKAPVVVTDARLDKLCALLAKYYSLKRFVGEAVGGAGPTAGATSTSSIAERWSAARDEPWFHYSSGLEAVVVALGVCRRVSLFGFGKAASQHHYHSSHRRRELHLHDYAAEYQLYRDLQLLTTINTTASAAAATNHAMPMAMKRSGPDLIIPFLCDSRFPLPPLLVHCSLAVPPL